jgi:hypothetical protein
MDCTSPKNSSIASTTTNSTCIRISDNNRNRKAAATVATSGLVVHFGSVLVMEMEQILGDHPAVSTGPPLALGWNLIFKRNYHTIEAFEQQQQQDETTISASLRLHRDKQLHRILHRTESCDVTSSGRQRSFGQLYLNHSQRVMR